MGQLLSHPGLLEDDHGVGESTHGSAAACQTMFMDVEKPEASTPVSADKANSGANVALCAHKVSTLSEPRSASEESDSQVDDEHRTRTSERSVHVQHPYARGRA